VQDSTITNHIPSHNKPWCNIWSKALYSTITHLHVIQTINVYHRIHIEHATITQDWNDRHITDRDQMGCTCSLSVWTICEWMQWTHLSNQTNIIQTQWFFELRECPIKKRRFIFYRWKPCYKLFKYNRSSMGLTDFVRLCCNASAVNAMNNTVLRPQPNSYIQAQWLFKCLIKSFYKWLILYRQKPLMV